MRHGQVELDWADGTYSFRLAIDGVEELEEKCDLGIIEIAARLQARTCRLKQISEVLRIGLIGGGMKPVDALKLVRRHVDERPVDENRDVAYAVVLAGLLRVNGTLLPGESVAAGSDASISPPSTVAET